MHPVPYESTGARTARLSTGASACRPKLVVRIDAGWMDSERLDQVLGDQDGVIARFQVLACGGDDDLLTMRAGWAQVVAACRLAEVVGRVLGARGWTDTPRTCPACGDRVRLPA